MFRAHEHTTPVSLTRADLEVLRLAATGMMSEQIARQLGRSPDDVRASFQVVIATLGARSKFEAMLIALRRGLIVPLDA